jgi:UDP-N-acetylmuramate: L-alanyl-gamma-D-glutamyl-meso-diaminopimelate ligase
LIDGKDNFRLEIFGEHNLQNLNAAMLVCQELGINKSDFYTAISSFKGASKRLELVKRGDNAVVYKDFAHSPSKLKATSSAMKSQYADRTLVACMELHTFSSLNKDFLKEYLGAMDTPDIAIVYFSKAAIAHKKLEDLSVEQVHTAFGRKDLMVFTESNELQAYLKSLVWKDQNLLMMSSGNFDGIDFGALAEDLLVS